MRKTEDLKNKFLKGYNRVFIKPRYIPRGRVLNREKYLKDIHSRPVVVKAIDEALKNAYIPKSAVMFELRIFFTIEDRLERVEVGKQLSEDDRVKIDDPNIGIVVSYAVSGLFL